MAISVGEKNSKAEDDNVFFFSIWLCLVFTEVVVFFNSRYQVSVTDNTPQDNISLSYYLRWRKS